MFQVGFSRIDVTPPLGTPVAGYGQKRISDHILDPIELNCIAFSDGERKGVLITADVLQVSQALAEKIRNGIEKRCGIPAERVFMQALHQHTSIRVEVRPAGLGPDPDYLDLLFRKYCDVASLALADLADAEVFAAERQAGEPLSFIRRHRLKDGTCKTNPGWGNPNVLEPLGESDNTVRLIRFQREAGDVALINFHCHPDVIGGTGFSADWPGFVRKHTERLLPGTKCILVNGPQGDSNHYNVYLPREEGLKRRGYKYADYMGKVIAHTAFLLWDQGRPMKAGTVWGKCETVYSPTANGGKDDPLFQKIAVTVLGIGEVAFVGFGGEAFTKYAQNARDAAKDLYVLSATLTNGAAGYLPTKKSFEESGYEVRAGKFSPCLEKDLTDCASKLLDEYKMQIQKGK